MPTDRRFIWLLLLLGGLACGGGDGGTSEPPLPVQVTVTPESDTVTVGASVQLSAVVVGNSNSGVTWSVVGGAASGLVSPLGLYTAGATPGIVKVVARSIAEPVGSDTARVMLVAAPSGTITSPDSAARDTPGLVASITPTAGATYLWAVTGGSLTAGQGSASITVTSGSGSSLQVSCAVRNLADSAVTASSHTTLVAGPEIASFTASRDTVTVGEGTAIAGVFNDGSGVVDGGIGPVTSGVSKSVGPFSTGYAGTTLTLTVTGFRGLTRTATVRIISVNPPVLNQFRPIGSKAPVGGNGEFVLSWNQDPGVTTAIQPGVGPVTTATPLTPVLTTPGKTTYTATVRSPGADSVVSDTASITAVMPAGGEFVATGSLNIGRSNFTATLLLDGRVLVAGGGDGSSPPALASAELYDPGTGAFSLTASLSTRRSRHVAARLSDGRVIVAGGEDNLGPSTMEIFDPTTGTWIPGPGLQQTVHAAVTMSDGRVLFVPVSGAAEIYDPVGGTVSQTGGVIGAQREMGVIPLAGNRVLSAGGIDQNLPLMTAQVFDASTGQFTSTGQMHSAHWQGTFTLLADGRVLAAGGWADFIQHLAAAGEVYDPVTGQWTVVGSLSTPRNLSGAALLPNGTVLVSGGLNELGIRARYAEVFDPMSGQFTPTLGNLSLTSLVTQVVRLGNGMVLHLNAGSGVGPLSPAAELFQP